MYSESAEFGTTEVIVSPVDIQTVTHIAPIKPESFENVGECLEVHSETHFSLSLLEILTVQLRSKLLCA